MRTQALKGFRKSMEIILTVTPQSFQNMMGYMPTHFFQKIQNARLQKQEDENSSGGSCSNQNKYQESNLRWSVFAKIVNR